MRSPGEAPPRPDLGWLRHRRVEHAHIEYVHPPHARPAAQAHMSAQAPPAARPAPQPTSPSLDLSTPAPVPVASAGPRTPAGPPTRATRSRPRTLPYPRVTPGSTVVLAGARPTATLTRLQSGVGQLRVALARGAGAGDLAMGLICETIDGATYVVQRLGEALATPATPLPLARMVTEGGLDTVLMDLRQVRRLRRFLAYGYSPSVSVLTWDGVVVASTYDGSRLEAPFDLPPLSGTVALLTGYVVHGELVLRAELEAFAGPPEMATEAYGYGYGWLGGRLPVP